MQTSIDIKDTVEMFQHVAQAIICEEKNLTAIDKKIGDGDHGIGMSRGFQEVLKVLRDREFVTVNEVFQTIGMTLLDTMGGASGVLFGTIFISGLVGEQEHGRLDVAIMAHFFEKSLQALKRRGKAQVGDKTMIDALQPAVESLVESGNRRLPLGQALQLAAEQAFAGKEYTKQCVAKFGRAKSYKDQSLGYEDAGAVSVWIIFQAMAQWAHTKAGV